MNFSRVLISLVVMGAAGDAAFAVEFVEKQLTFAPHGHILTNTAVWSPDSKWIVYDLRSDAEGALFDGTRIERVNVETGEVERLYESENGVCVGVATYSPLEDKVVFIHGPEHPTPEWSYSATRRQGVLVTVGPPGVAVNLDARDITPPLTPGALRGGSHVHVFSGDGRLVSFTYQDHLLERYKVASPANDIDQRNVGIAVPDRPVQVATDHPRNHSGEYFSVLVTRTTAFPIPGSDEITKAYEDAWVGTEGYRRADGTWQNYALAFQGDVVAPGGKSITEVFIVDLPEDLTVPGEGPLEGTASRRPLPPRGTQQRRLTFTADRRYPGIQGPRHWLRSSPDGTRIAFLMRDDDGIVQLWTVSPNGGEPNQLTRNPWPIASAFSWSPDGTSITHVMDNSVFLTDIASGQSRRATARTPNGLAPRPEACVFSPDGEKIAYVRQVNHAGKQWNQIFITSISAPGRSGDRQ